MVDRLEKELLGGDEHEARARRIAEKMALVLQASLLIRHSPQSIADAFCATRLDGDGGAEYGSLPAGLDQKGIVDRARVTADA
jgi:putative acyl-CoA dehydrogenase